MATLLYELLDIWKAAVKSVEFIAWSCVCRLNRAWDSSGDSFLELPQTNQNQILSVWTFNILTQREAGAKFDGG